MKKVILFLAAAICSVLMVAQTNQVTWVNGRAVLGQSISSIDSIKYGTIVKSQKLELWLPETIVVHDTVIVHDTIINKCDSSHAPEGVELVDLGLSVKWANMNVGATTPEGYGDRFYWGETEPREENESTYKWGDHFNFTKYTYIDAYNPDDDRESFWYNDEGVFIGDLKNTLDPEDDAAHVNWGGNWRMPTAAEIFELQNKCTWEWVALQGVNGYKVVGSNGNWIFLPYWSPYGGYSPYWSSSLSCHNSCCAWSLAISSSQVVTYDNFTRYNRYTVRPVCK